MAEFKWVGNRSSKSKVPLETIVKRLVQPQVPEPVYPQLHEIGTKDLISPILVITTAKRRLYYGLKAHLEDESSWKKVILDKKLQADLFRLLFIYVGEHNLKDNLIDVCCHHVWVWKIPKRDVEDLVGRIKEVAERAIGKSLKVDFRKDMPLAYTDGSSAYTYARLARA